MALELGGKSPNVILEDADLDAAVSSVLGAGAPDTTSGWDDALRAALSTTAGVR